MTDERLVASLLVRLTDSLGRPSADDLLDQCNAAVIACLARTRIERAEPKAPTTDELVALADRVMRARPDERPVVLREIRSALGRLDMHRAI
ncbi:MAG TPA: hypothetical protein VH143_28230 [Kofleriaceae bacterium]|jgi:hypothetical protein|nr:hypothetical protein [Kofleriaceae bacterium]